MYISMSRYLLLCSRAVARCEKLAWVLRVQEADLRTQSGSWRQWALLGMGGRHLEGGARHVGEGLDVRHVAHHANKAP